MRNRILERLLIMVLFMIAPLTLLAQAPVDPPCGDQDNPFDTPCPLDTWVVPLVIVAAIGGAFYLHRKRKLLQEQESFTQSTKIDDR